MNEILQKRIEEAAQQCATTTDGKIISFAYLAAKQMADFILNNLWISVEEASPEKEGRYLCNYRHKFSNSDSDAECDCVDFGLFKDGIWYIGNNEVTHWMPIPTLHEKE